MSAAAARVTIALAIASVLGPGFAAAAAAAKSKPKPSPPGAPRGDDLAAAGASTIHLRPMAPEEVGELAATVLGAPPGPVLAGLLAKAVLVADAA